MDEEGARAGEEEAPTGAVMVARVGYAPITRVDAARREIELCATSETVDSHGTVFDYAASTDAFTRWIGNVREMHERRAVGSRVSVRCDDETRQIFVRVRISRGAGDTWEKVMDGTLRSASIGAANVTWERQRRRVAGHTRWLDVATRYDLVELSLVDNPSNPDALGITFVRDALPDLTLLDTLEDDAPAADVLEDDTPAADALEDDALEDDALEDDGPAVWASSAPVAARMTVLTAPRAAPRALLEPRCARAEVSAPLNPATPTLWSLARDESAVAVEMTAAAGMRARGPFSPNAAGAPDLGVPGRAEARPTSALGLAPAGNARERFHAAARAILLGCGCLECAAALAALDDAPAEEEADVPSLEGRAHAEAATGARHAREAALARAVTAGLHASAARLERVDAGLCELRTLLATAAGRTDGTLDGLRARLEALEAQPLPDGPVARAVEKVHALAPNAPDSAGGPLATAQQLRALESLAGRLTDPQAQIAVAAEMIRLRQS